MARTAITTKVAKAEVGKDGTAYIDLELSGTVEHEGRSITINPPATLRVAVPPDHKDIVTNDAVATRRSDPRIQSKV
jgi:hypothetical protein